MRKKFVLFGGCVVAFVVIYVSCRKVDYKAENKSEKQIKPGSAFFDAHPSADPGVKAIASLMRRENDKYGFLQSITSMVGYPHWDKTIILKGNSVAGRGNSGDTANYFYIPFVRDSQQYVNASLIVKTGGGDTAVRWLSDWQYADYGFDTTNAEAPNARKAFLTLANLGISTFGQHNYLVKDGRIFGYPDTQKLKVSVDPPSAGNGGTYGRGADEYFTICNKVSICVVAGNSQSARGMDDPYSSGCGGTLTHVLYCNIYMFYGGGGGGNTGWTPMGSGYIPDPGGTGGNGFPPGYIEGWSPPPNPCGSVTQRGGAIQVCESSWVVIDDLPSAQSEPVDTLLKKYSVLANRYRDSLASLCESEHKERFFNIVNSNNQLDTFRVLTSKTDDEVMPNYNMVGGRILKGSWHYHPKYSDGTPGSWPSGGDIAQLYDKEQGFVMIIDAVNARYALVVENKTLMNAWEHIFGNGKVQLPYRIRDAVYADPRASSQIPEIYLQMNKEILLSMLGSSNICGIGLYKASSEKGTTFTKIN